MKVLVSGSSGFLGKNLVFYLKQKGHEVISLVRTQNKGENTVYWNPEKGIIGKLPPIDAAIHLSGENIGNERWTKEKKKKILDSRVLSTRLLAKTFSEMTTPPKMWLCASACGFYGNQGDKKLTEESPKGKGFLSDVCQEWEKETQSVKAKGIRVASLRFGIILSPQGGVLEKMLIPFKLGLGGPIGNGKQYVSWISLDDAVSAIHHCLICEKIQGPVNLVAPEPITNEGFSKLLGKILNRPTVFFIPNMAPRIMLGEMGEELVLYSIRSMPAKLLETGYSFIHPDMETALRYLLKNS
ncbi:MAG: TIGR01777 family protein [Candidatus Brocadiae bacterium]|nr:TIGR01777 family protein [Candidatus Brocadiia bacterium]